MRITPPVSKARHDMSAGDIDDVGLVTVHQDHERARCGAWMFHPLKYLAAERERLFTLRYDLVGLRAEMHRSRIRPVCADAGITVGVKRRHRRGQLAAGLQIPARD